MLQSTRSQRVRHDLAIEQQQQQNTNNVNYGFYIYCFYYVEIVSLYF